jgi:gluconolactonase
MFVSDGRGGITRIEPDGSQQFIGGLGGEPNGLTLLDDGSILVANIGTGGIQKLSPDGRVEDFLTEVDGVRVSSANYLSSHVIYAGRRDYSGLRLLDPPFSAYLDRL